MGGTRSWDHHGIIDNGAATNRPGKKCGGWSKNRQTVVAFELVSAIILRNTLEREETTMAWTTPTLVEICIGLEINGYLPAEF